MVKSRKNKNKAITVETITPSTVVLEGFAGYIIDYVEMTSLVYSIAIANFTFFVIMDLPTLGTVTFANKPIKLCFIESGYTYVLFMIATVLNFTL